MNKVFSKIAYYGCWLLILLVSFIYASSSFSPWDADKYNFIEPLVHLDTKYYTLPQKIYGNSRIGLPPNEYLLEKASNFYSGIDSEFHATTHFRPDFEQFPVETILILFSRLFTYIGIVIFLFLLSQLLRSIYKNDPFDEKNFTRLFYMGMIGIFVPIIRILHSLVLASFITYNPRLLGYDMSPSFISLWLVLFGVLLLVLSFFFKETARIYEEQKLTV
ncbi:MAG: DUF2975 domain-containing protein [Gracilimonas sp.]